jgi:hypothetical protein
MKSAWVTAFVIVFAFPLPQFAVAGIRLRMRQVPLGYRLRKGVG